ncbi:MAG TPA: glycosyltransferase family 2 protein, partial [Candidatus Eisenbergiella stercorigallinarum]|nr:glycosyltransferase family 2 protein [Candidatus Eisenbergiella stercorigallinarum]
MSEIKLLALIITYNRLPLLKECIQAVLGQTWNPFGILVIDNHSTDGTWEYLKTLEGKDGISFLRLEQNTGGSGGFHIGIREALHRGYSHIWLMDDDTVPDIHAAERLLSADRLLGEYGFLVSLPVWKDGSLCKMNLPLPGQFRREKGHILQEGLLPVRKATFVSMLLKADIVREVGLPIREFFIWGDDQEYTERISKKYKCYLVLSSVVQHKTQNNLGSDISTDSPERIERYYYA